MEIRRAQWRQCGPVFSFAQLSRALWSISSSGVRPNPECCARRQHYFRWRRWSPEISLPEPPQRHDGLHEIPLTSTLVLPIQLWPSYQPFQYIRQATSRHPHHPHLAELQGASTSAQAQAQESNWKVGSWIPFWWREHCFHCNTKDLRKLFSTIRHQNIPEAFLAIGSWALQASH